MQQETAQEEEIIEETVVNCNILKNNLIWLSFSIVMRMGFIVRMLCETLCDEGYTSHVTRHTSHVTRHTSHVTCVEGTNTFGFAAAASDMTFLHHT